MEELRYILADSGAVALVLESAELFARLALTPEALAGLRFLLVLEGPAPEATGLTCLTCLSWEQLQERGAAAPPPAPARNP